MFFYKKEIKFIKVVLYYYMRKEVIMKIESCNSQTEAKEILKLEYIPEDIAEIFFDYINKNKKRAYTWLLLSDYYLKVGNPTMAKQALKNHFIITKKNKREPGAHAYFNAYSISVQKHDYVNAWGALQKNKEKLKKQAIPYDFSLDEALLLHLIYIQQRKQFPKIKPISSSSFVGTFDTRYVKNGQEILNHIRTLQKALKELDFKKFHYYLKESEAQFHLNHQPFYNIMFEDLKNAINDHHSSLSKIFQEEKKEALLKNDIQAYLATLNREIHCYPNNIRYILQDCYQLIQEYNMEFAKAILSYLKEGRMPSKTQSILRYLEEELKKSDTTYINNMDLIWYYQDYIKSLDLNQAGAATTEIVQATGEVDFYLLLAKMYYQHYNRQKMEETLKEYIQKGGQNRKEVFQLAIHVKGKFSKVLQDYLEESIMIESYLNIGNYFQSLHDQQSQKIYWQTKPTGENQYDFLLPEEPSNPKGLPPLPKQKKKYDYLMRQLKKESKKNAG